MGPIYGTVFMAMADEADGKEDYSFRSVPDAGSGEKGAGRELVEQEQEINAMDTLTHLAVAALEKSRPGGCRI